MKKKYAIKWIKYDDLEFCMCYFDKLHGDNVFWYEMHEDFYKELKSGKRPKYLILDDEDIDDEYWEIEY